VNYPSSDGCGVIRAGPSRVVSCVDVREIYKRDLVLVRPEDNLAWRGNAAPSDGTALMDHVTGWLTGNRF